MSSPNGRRDPLVTVLLCVHNGERFLRPAVESILAQSFGDFEFLIVNDASVDSSGRILAAYRDSRIRIVENGVNLGLTRSLNRGLALARGELVARLDADDVALPERLARQVAFLRRHEDVAILGTQAELIDARGQQVPARFAPRCTTDLAIRWQLLFDSPFVHSSVIMRRRAVWDELGGYDEAFRTSQDYELWSRAARRFSLRNLAEPLVQFRVSHGSTSTTYSAENVERVRAVFRGNFEYWLRRPTAPEAWIDFWLRVTNPRVFGRPTDARQRLDTIAAVYRRFVSLHREAARDREILRHIAHTLLRIGRTIAPVDLRAALRSCVGACRADPRATAVALARLVAYSIVRPRLR